MGVIIPPLLGQDNFPCQVKRVLEAAPAVRELAPRVPERTVLGVQPDFKYNR